MAIIMQDPTDNAEKPLPQRLEDWRLRDNHTGEKLTLQEAKAILGISIGYISDLEAGKQPVTMRVYQKYNAAAPHLFPLTQAGLLL